MATKLFLQVSREVPGAITGGPSLPVGIHLELVGNRRFFNGEYWVPVSVDGVRFDIPEVFTY